MTSERPPGLEELVRRAAADPQARARLLRERGALAEELGIALDPGEVARLAAASGAEVEAWLLGAGEPAPGGASSDRGSPSAPPDRVPVPAGIRVPEPPPPAPVPAPQRPIPRGLEAALQRAADDPAFAARLLDERSRAAGELGPLDPAEVVMLDGSGREQLEGLIAGVAARRGAPPAPWAARPDHPPVTLCGGAAPDRPVWREPRGCLALAPLRWLLRLLGW